MNDHVTDEILKTRQEMLAAGYSYAVEGVPGCYVKDDDEKFTPKGIVESLLGVSNILTLEELIEFREGLTRLIQAKDRELVEFRERLTRSIQAKEPS